MTIKKKIVIWYTIWMALLAVILLFVIFVSSGTMMRREMVSELEEAVHDAYDDLEWRRGQYDFDEIDEYDDGVFIQIFSSDGTLLFGRNESEFPSDFAVGRFRESGEWVIFEQGFEDGLIIRSLMRSYIAAGFINSVSISALVFLPVIVILAAAGGYIITRKSFKPADQAIRAAIDISSSNDLSKRINLGESNDEIHKMASTFDRVLDRLEEAFQKEKQFTSDASHELRTPLAVIKAVRRVLLFAFFAQQQQRFFLVAVETRVFQRFLDKFGLAGLQKAGKQIYWNLSCHPFSPLSSGQTARQLRFHSAWSRLRTDGR